jgi:hypothetical protein
VKTTYSYKWLVKIPSGQWMAGIHRFKTKHAAREFVDKWNCTPGHTLTYSELPQVTKAWEETHGHKDNI